MLCKHYLLKCGIEILLPLVRFDDQLVLDKVILILTTENTISKKISVKASAANSSGKSSPGDKTLGIETLIRLYDVEDNGETE